MTFHNTKLGKTRKRCRRMRGQELAPYVFVSPFAIVFCVFSLWPLVKSFMLAFYVTNGPKSAVFVGLDNFRFLLSDPDFFIAVRNTATFAFFSLCLQLPLSLGLAILLSRKWVRGKDLLRLAFFSPNLLGSVFVGVLFSVIFIPEYGLLNKALHAIAGVPLDTRWLGDPLLVMPALILTSLWMYVGFNMVYFLAALQAVDGELYDAARVDGANGWQTFRAVTVPGIKPVAVFVAIMSTIGSFQLFELPLAMLNYTSGPDKAGLTIVMYLYQWGYDNNDLGYASTIGLTLAFIVMMVSLIQLKLSGTMKGVEA